MIRSEFLDDLARLISSRRMNSHHSFFYSSDKYGSAVQFALDSICFVYLGNSDLSNLRKYHFYIKYNFNESPFNKYQIYFMDWLLNRSIFKDIFNEHHNAYDFLHNGGFINTKLGTRHTVAGLIAGRFPIEYPVKTKTFYRLVTELNIPENIAYPLSYFISSSDFTFYRASQYHYLFEFDWLFNKILMRNYLNSTPLNEDDKFYINSQYNNLYKFLVDEIFIETREPEFLKDLKFTSDWYVRYINWINDE